MDSTTSYSCNSNNRLCTSIKPIMTYCKTTFTSSTSLSSLNNNNNNQNINQNHDRDPFVDEADELFYYMNMFEEEEDDNNNNNEDCDDDDKDGQKNKQKEKIGRIKEHNMKGQQTNTKNHNLIKKIDDKQLDGPYKYDNKNRIDILIVPDLSTLLSSAAAGTTAVETTINDTNQTTNRSSTTHKQQQNQPICTKYIEGLAPAESIAYFYLQNTIGLPPDIMWKITNQVGSVLGFTVPNLKQKISFLERIMNLSKEDIRIIVSKQPSILHLSSNRNISQKVLFLVRALDLSKEDLRFMVVSYPCILCYSIPNLQKKISFFQNVMGFGEDIAVGGGGGGKDGDSRIHGDGTINNELRELLVRNPKLLTAAVDDSNYYNNNYDNEYDYKKNEDFGDKDDNNDDNEQGSYYLSNHPTVRRNRETRGTGGLLAKFLFLYQEIGIPIDDLKYIVKRNPNILHYSLQNNLQPKIISLFIMRLGMDSVQICKILKSFPGIMDYNLENHLLPITRYFLTDLEFSPMEFRSIVLKFPKVFSHSMFKIKHVVGYFRYQLGMNASQVKRILFQAPQVISLNTDNTLVAKVEFMREVFGISSSQHQFQNSSGSSSSGSSSSVLSDIRKVIAGMPTLLLCSLESNLRPKAEYFLEVFGGDQLELRQAVVTLPTLLGYSLEKRIKPRMKMILDANIEPIKITVGITMTEDNFRKWLMNQKLRVEKKGRSVARKRKISKISSEEELIRGEEGVESNDHSLGAIVLWKTNDGDDEGSGRIMHWKR